VAAGKTSCWCFSATVPPEVVERVSEEVRGSMCVCAKCARQTAAGAERAVTAAAGNEER
jgi:hypothetical protein